MARFNIDTDVQVPQKITINLIREDFLDTSHTYRIFFEIFLALFGAIGGSVISSFNTQIEIPTITYCFLCVTFLACGAFLYLSIKHYNKSKCKEKDVN